MRGENIEKKCVFLNQTLILLLFRLLGMFNEGGVFWERSNRMGLGMFNEGEV